MSVTFGFYNSIGGDRKYNATQMSSLFDGIIKDGVFMSIEDALVVNATTGMNVSVSEGRAWFNRTWTNNDSPLVLTVAQSEVILNRIDAVVLEVNSTDAVRANSIKIIKGTPSSSPVAPSMTRSDLINQYSLCHIYVGAGVTQITQANITNKIGTSECPFVTGILETLDVDVLLAQWNAEFDEWLESIQGVLDGDTAGNLLNLINNRIVKGTSTIPTTGWVVNVGDNPLKLNLPISGVVVGNWVDVTIDKEYQDIALAAQINPTVDEYNGGITFYANTAPSVAIPIRYKVVN